jgi:hypothetical protein
MVSGPVVAVSSCADVPANGHFLFSRLVLFLLAVKALMQNEINPDLIWLQEHATVRK